MGTPSQVFDSVAPELAANAAKPTWIELATLRVSKKVFGDVYTFAVAYLAAHIGTLAVRQADAGAGGQTSIASRSEGSLSISYGDSSAIGEGGDYKTTGYGRQFLALRRERVMGARTRFV